MSSPYTYRYGGWFALAAGALLPLAFAPFNYYVLAPLLVGALFFLWNRATSRQAAWLGFVFGIGAFVTGTHWLYVSLHVFGKVPVSLTLPLMAALMAFMAAYTALLGYAAIRFFPKPGPVRWLLVLPAGWLLTEWLRGWLLTGFPWLSLGYTTTDSVLAGWIPVGGVYAAGLAVTLSAGAVCALIAGSKPVRVVAAAVLLSVWIGGAVLSTIAWTDAGDDTLQVSIVQGAIPQDRKWLPEELLPTMRLYRDLSSQHWDSDLIIWPEAAIPALRTSLTQYYAAVREQSLGHDTAVVLGMIEHRRETGQFYNGVMALDETVSTYYKRHLVPFGEYFPVPDFVRNWMRVRNLPYSDYTPGDDDQAPLPVAGVHVGVSICYEDVFGEELRTVLPDATLLVNVSNDAWFGTTIAPWQHLQIAQTRAREAGRYLLRATNTGVSAVIGPDGQVQQTIPQFETQVLTATVRPFTGLTPYARWGDKVVVTLAIILLAAAALLHRAP